MSSSILSLRYLFSPSKKKEEEEDI